MTKTIKTDAGFKRSVNVRFPVRAGYEREFVKCKKCGNRAYYDYVPRSLSNPIMTSPCGHHPVMDYYKSI